MIPAIFMTAVSTSFLLVSKDALHLDPTIGSWGGVITAAVCLVFFMRWHHKKFNVTLRTDKYGNPIKKK
jgi:hypothetical protein